MVESAGAFGPWFEWGMSPQRTETAVKPDPRLLAYQAECKRIFEGLRVINFALIDKIGIPIRDSSLGDGLILRETFQERDPFNRRKLSLMAFLITPTAIFEVGPLTSKALERAEGAQINFRLERLMFGSKKMRITDLFCESDRDGFWDVEKFSSIIKQSVKTAATKVGPEEYILKRISLS